MIKAKKSLGQNFLIDENVARRIRDVVSPNQHDIILEIGPGTGAITRLLLESGGYVVAIEIDPRLIERLSKEIRDKTINIIEADALNLDWRKLIDKSIAEWQTLYPNKPEQPCVRVVANLPYYISTPIVERLINLGREISDMTLMLQEEVVNRITAAPGSKEYGYLSVLVQFHAFATKIFRVPPSAFHPVPRVWSAIINLRSRPEPAVTVDDEKRFFTLVRAAFAQRRKTILNNLKAAGHLLPLREDFVTALEKANIDAKRRAETLSIEDFARLYWRLFLD